MSLIENLKWRYATKRYDANKKVSTSDINTIKEAIQLAATSYGLQLFKVIDVTSNELRTKLQPASWNQPQITEASHLFVFCNYSEVKENHIDDYINLKAETQDLNAEDLKGYGDFMKNGLLNNPKDQNQVWMAKQTYIALGNAMAACAELKIDSTPMEGFEAAEYDKILNLEEKGLQSAVVLAIGYRSDEDATQHGKKVRKTLDSLFETI